MPPAQTVRASAGPDDATVTPDEVLTLGVLALAGLWPGTWCAVAAIMIRKVERLAQRGVGDVAFRRCAQSLVDMLLRSPGDANLAVETWQQLATAQARLPDDLAQVLGLACSLLQRQTMEAADIRAKKKRRRAFSSETVASLSAPLPQATTPPCATALVVMVSDVDREEEQNKIETEMEVLRLAAPPVPSSAPPPPPPRSLPSSLLPPTSALQPLSVAPAPDPQPQASPVLPLQVSQEAALRPQQVPPQMLPSSAHVLPPMAPMATTVADHLQNGDGWGSAASGGGVAGMGAGFAPSMPHPVMPPHRPTADWNFNGGHHGMQGSYSLPLAQPSPPRGADYGLHLTRAESEGGMVVQHTSSVNDAIGAASSSIP